MDEKTKPKRKIKPLVVLIIIATSLLLLFAVYIIYQRYFSKDASQANSVAHKTSNKIANDLDGIKVDPDRAKRYPLAIMIENHPDARPQAGLDNASIVYEAITEGGITRFMAIYGPNDATKVGPVRSARIYFIDWVAEFKAFYAHCGGNIDALEKIKKDNILDMDQFALGEKAYWRIYKAGVATEHTMYTSTEKLYQAAKEKNWPSEGSFTPLKFTNSVRETLKDLGQKISIKFSSASYNVSWTYDTKTNTYLRNMADKPHTDELSGKQLASTNVIIQRMERWEAITSINEQGWDMKTIGSDKAMVFSDGKQIDGIWKKTDQSSRTKFYDSQGIEISFIPGQFWIEIVPPDVYDDIKVEVIPKTVS